jgi:hypothetical protein
MRKDSKIDFAGVVHHNMYNFPQKWGWEHCGVLVASTLFEEAEMLGYTYDPILDRALLEDSFTSITSNKFFYP